MTRKKNPVRYDYHLGHLDLQRVNEEKDLGVMITSRLTWETQVLMVTGKANKLLGLLRLQPSDALCLSEFIQPILGLKAAIEEPGNVCIG